MATSTTALTVTGAASRARRPRGALAQSAGAFARDRQAMVGLLIIAILGGAALAAPLVSPWDPLTSAAVASTRSSKRSRSAANFRSRLGESGSS